MTKKEENGKQITTRHRRRVVLQPHVIDTTLRRQQP
jgi:hypothetical protein